MSGRSAACPEYARLRLMEMDMCGRILQKVQRNWIKQRDNKCIYIDKSDDSGFMKPRCHAMHLALSTWYLKRLNSIQFDEQGLPTINNVIKEYSQRVKNS